MISFLLDAFALTISARACSHGTCLALEVVEEGEEVGREPLAFASFKDLPMLVI